jgi:hypothetical protein
VSDKRATYHSYLLRLWRVSGAQEATWRASLEDPQTGERIGFASLDAMVADLRQQTEPTPIQKVETSQDAISSEGGT